MACPCSSSLGLVLLLIAGVAAGPQLDRPPPAVRSSACQEYANLHSRLDLVEKKVEDTVGAVEAGLASLLEAIEAPEWRPLLSKAGGKPADVILEEPRREVRWSTGDGLTSA